MPQKKQERRRFCCENKGMFTLIHTFDASEIPRPTTWDVKKQLQILGQTTKLNWIAGFLNHQQ